VRDSTLRRLGISFMKYGSKKKKNLWKLPKSTLRVYNMISVVRSSIKSLLLIFLLRAVECITSFFCQMRIPTIPHSNLQYFLFKNAFNMLSNTYGHDFTNLPIWHIVSRTLRFISSSSTTASIHFGRFCLWWDVTIMWSKAIVWNVNIFVCKCLNIVLLAECVITISS
jgi:hypothetical protein